MNTFSHDSLDECLDENLSDKEYYREVSFISVNSHVDIEGE